MAERQMTTDETSKAMGNSKGRRESMGSLGAKLTALAVCACATLAVAAPGAWAGYQPLNEHTAIGGTTGYYHGEFMPRGMSVDPTTHDLFLGGMAFEGRLHKWDGTTEVETIFGREQFWGYFGVAVDPKTHYVYALNSENQRLEKFFPNGKKATPAFFQTEGNGGVSIGPEGHIFIPKSPGRFNFIKIPGGEGVILEYNKGGELLHTISCTGCPAPESFNGPVTTAQDAEGNLYVADSENHRVIKFDNDEGEFVNPTVFSTGPSTALAIDRTTGRVFVGGNVPPVEEFEQTPFFVTVYDSQGNELEQFGLGMFGDLYNLYGGGDQIAVDQGTGRVFVDDLRPTVNCNCGKSMEVQVWEFGEFLPPIAATEPATVEASRHVTLNATVNPNGNLVLSCHFEYGLTEAYGQFVPCSPDPGFEREPESTSAEISGLQPNTTYHYKVVVTNEGGTVEGEDEEFKTLIDKPVVITGNASGVTPFAATISGSVNPLANPTSFCRFEYGKSAEYGTQMPCPTDPGTGGSSVAESVGLSGLEPSTTYHYRLIAGNAGGTEPGADATFTTLAHSPTATTGPATNILPDGAKLLGKVNAQGSVTSYRFEYGTSTAYGQSTSAGSVVGSEDEEISAVLSSLTPNTTYHFRMAATNVGGTTYGQDQTFTTLIRPVGHAAIAARGQVKHGMAMIPLTCKGEAIAECKGTLTLRARLKRGIRFILVTVGSADYDFFGKQVKVVGVKLNGDGRKVLAQSGGKPVPAIASAGGANRELRLFLGHGRHHHRAHHRNG